MPIGPLMIEHRLIERMIEVLRIETGKAASQRTVDPVVVDSAVDFIRTYADRTHHGKEEDILFRDLDQKGLSSEDRKVMEELVHEHTNARRMVRELVEAQERYLGGDAGAVEVVVARLQALVGLYPGHIRLERKTRYSFRPRSSTSLTQSRTPCWRRCGHLTGG